MRPYTGFDGNVKRPWPSMNRFVDYTTFLTGGGLWNNGAWGVRDRRGRPSNPSVHGTGRAVDLSWRKMRLGRGRRGFGDWWAAADFYEFLLKNADVLKIEHMVDYTPRPHGRAFRCDRDLGWYNYSRPTVQGAPGGDWLHVEISPVAAADPTFYDAAFKKALGL